MFERSRMFFKQRTEVWMAIVESGWSAVFLAAASPFLCSFLKCFFVLVTNYIHVILMFERSRMFFKQRTEVWMAIVESGWSAVFLAAASPFLCSFLKCFVVLVINYIHVILMFERSRMFFKQRTEVWMAIVESGWSAVFLAAASPFLCSFKKMYFRSCN